MQSSKKRHYPALFAGLTAFGLTAVAAERTLNTPATSGFVDTESAVNVSLADWEGLGRRITLTLSANVSPSNAVRVAFGKDRNGDDDLAPEETDFVVGCDCGEWFARDERTKRLPGYVTISEPSATEQPTATNRQSRLVRFRQPSDMTARWNLAKVTTHGFEDSAASLVAEIINPGNHLILK